MTRILNNLFEKIADVLRSFNRDARLKAYRNQARWPIERDRASRDLSTYPIENLSPVRVAGMVKQNPNTPARTHHQTPGRCRLSATTNLTLLGL
jgi:hypothetical protein